MFQIGRVMAEGINLRSLISENQFRSSFVVDILAKWPGYLRVITLSPICVIKLMSSFTNPYYKNDNELERLGRILTFYGRFSSRPCVVQLLFSFQQVWPPALHIRFLFTYLSATCCTGMPPSAVTVNRDSLRCRFRYVYPCYVSYMFSNILHLSTVMACTDCTTTQVLKRRSITAEAWL